MVVRVLMHLQHVWNSSGVCSALSARHQLKSIFPSSFLSTARVQPAFSTACLVPITRLYSNEQNRWWFDGCYSICQWFFCLNRSSDPEVMRCHEAWVILAIWSTIKTINAQSPRHTSIACWTFMRSSTSRWRFAVGTMGLVIAQVITTKFNVFVGVERPVYCWLQVRIICSKYTD